MLIAKITSSIITLSIIAIWFFFFYAISKAIQDHKTTKELNTKLLKEQNQLLREQNELLRTKD